MIKNLNYCNYQARTRSTRARRAFTGRRCPDSGRGKDFLTGQLNFFTETAVTPERKVEKGWKLIVMPRAKYGSLTKIWVVWQKSDFFAKNRDFGPKKGPLLYSNHVLATTGKSCSKKKVAFAQIIITQNDISPLDYLGKGTFFLSTTFSGRG